MQNKYSKLFLGLSVVIAGIFVDSAVLYGMELEQQEEAKNFQICFEEWLPRELKKQIIPAAFHDTVEFLCLQSIILAEDVCDCEKVVLTHDKAIIRSDYKTIRIWDTHTAQLLHTLQKEHFGSLAVSGDKMVIGSQEHSSAEIWDINNGKKLHTLYGHSDWVNSVAIDGDKVVVGSRDKFAYIWNANTGNLLHMLKHDGEVELVFISGNKVVTRSECGVLKIWDINNGKLIHTLPKHHSILAIADNKIVNDRAEIWDINSGQLLCALELTCEQEISAAAIVGNKVITGSYDTIIRVWNINSGKLLHTIQEHESYVRSIVVVGNKMMTRSCYKEWMVKVSDINTGQLLHTLPVWADTVSEGAMIDNKVVTGGYKCVPKIWTLFSKFQGTSDNNPIVWIVENATIPQLDFINRGYKAASDARQEPMIIALPKKFNKVKENELQAQWDGRVYFSFPQFVREYLRNRLQIFPTHSEKQIDKQNSPCVIQ